MQKCRGFFDSRRFLLLIRSMEKTNSYQELVSSYNTIRRDHSEDIIEIPEKDILKPVTTNYSTNSKIDANTNGNNTNQKTNSSSDTSTTKVQIVGELINNSVINKCYLCEKTVKSSNGLKLHLRSYKKKLALMIPIHGHQY